MPVSKKLEDLLVTYPDYLDGGVVSSDHKAFQLACREIPNEINRGLKEQNIDYQDRKIRGSTGQGAVAKSPWIRISRSQDSQKFSESIGNVVMLFSVDFQSLYLTVALRTEYGRRRSDEMQSRTETLGEFVKERLPDNLKNDDRLMFGPIDLRADKDKHGLAYSYQTSTICSIKYEKGAIPEDSQIISDILGFLDIHSGLAASDLNEALYDTHDNGYYALMRLSSRDAVIQSIAEFESIGRENFLAKYGFGKSRFWFLEYQGELYDIKAVTAVAHNYQFPDANIIAQEHIGTQDCEAKLQELGFEVTKVETGTKRLLPLNFERIDIHEGATLTYIEDRSITCTVLSARTVNFENDEYYLSILTGRLKESSTNLLPSRYWEYEGELLSDRRRRMERDASETPDLPAHDYGDRPYWFLKHQDWRGSERSIDEYLETNSFDTLGIFLSRVEEMEVGDPVILAKQTRVNQIEGYTLVDGQSVSEMRIYAIGKYLGTSSDRSQISVEWERLPNIRPWYVHMKTDRIWKVIPTHWKARNLLGFALFGDEQQELSLFAPYAFATASEEYSEEEESPEGRSASTPYSVEDIVSDGCFIPQSILEGYLDRLQTKKNIILQGPPGTGKTWLAKKLGFALIGSLDEQLMTRVQFHPNLSYEDFIRGWRPKGDGKLELADGPLMNTVDAALSRPGIPHVLVIEEINRGNPAQIFGEMLTLLEVDKRSSSESLKLSYSRTPSERVYVPDNLYLIGTMNIADRSLALVDLALRRRFAFLDLVPQFNSAWSDWAKEHGSLTTEFVNDIRSRISALNDEIAASNVLGAQFVVGHSYLTPHENTPITDANEWFRQVVTTEIGPLLEEYWFDQPKTAEEQTKLLLEGI